MDGDAFPDPGLDHVQMEEDAEEITDSFVAKEISHLALMNTWHRSNVQHISPEPTDEEKVKKKW